MDPSQSRRFNSDSVPTTSLPSSSGSPSRESSLSRRNSPPLTSHGSSSRMLFEHNLSSILNNPHTSRSGDASWVGWWSSSTSVALPEFAPINTSRPELEINKSDFRSYLNVVTEQFNRFEDIQKHASKENVESVLVDGIGGQGEALVACLREVPALYFKEDFQLEDGGTFRAACPFCTVAENLVLQERLSQYLDVVELHLVKEISLRSNSFFEAQRQLEDLNVKVIEGYTRIRELKDGVRLLDVDLVDSAREIQRLSGSRTNLLSVQQKLRLILYVNQALAALKLTSNHVSESMKCCCSDAVTFLCGRAGVCGLGAVVAKYAENEELLNYFLIQFKQIQLTEDLPDELLYGKCGYLWACLFINKYIGPGTIPSDFLGRIANEIIEGGRAMPNKGSWPLMYEWFGERYWGAAHGLAGIMYVLMQVEAIRTIDW